MCNHATRLWLSSLAVIALPGCGGQGSAPDPHASPDGTRARRSTTASTTIGAEELAATPATRVEELLAGRVPGLQVIRGTGGDFSIRIRGAHSFTGDDAPLLVIDGLPIHASGMSRALAGLHPRDVARIEVLRDAGATASYGVQGAHGVILITTRLHRP